jgi:hypothetical protein
VLLAALGVDDNAGVGAGLHQRRHDRAVAQLGAHHQVVRHQRLEGVGSVLDDGEPGVTQLSGDLLELLDPCMAGADRLDHVQQVHSATTPRGLQRRRTQGRKTTRRLDPDDDLAGEQVPHGAPPPSPW